MTVREGHFAYLFAAALLALGGPSLAVGQDARPSDEELFGGEPKPAAPESEGNAKAAPTPKPGPAETSGEHAGTEAELFGKPSAPPLPEGVVPHEKEDPLRIGGLLYLRSQATWYENQPASSGVLTYPNLMDVYLDSRPNDRVRAFALGRMFWDPSGGGTLPSSVLSQLQSIGAAPTPNPDPTVVLDQAWINFDLGRQVFVTAGRQHVKWGVGKFWNPTDYLHPMKRDPLNVFDERTGVTMVRAHWPWEAKGWNFYGVALLEDATGRGVLVNNVGQVGGGGRAEIVLGPAELGLDALAQKGARPRFGIDLSGGIWDLDLYSELAIRTDVDATVYQVVSPGTLGAYGPKGILPQLVLGARWSWKYSDEDVLNIGAEYFWNDVGYSDRSFYPFLLVAQGENPSTRAFTPFYLGKHYAGLFFNLPSPGSWNDSDFTLTTLANLSDRSFVVRFDHSTLALTYLRVETYVSVSGGREGGEFRLGFQVPAPPPATSGVLSVPSSILTVGVALRVSL